MPIIVHEQASGDSSNLEQTSSLNSVSSATQSAANTNRLESKSDLPLEV